MVVPLNNQTFVNFAAEKRALRRLESFGFLYKSEEVFFLVVKRY